MYIVTNIYRMAGKFDEIASKLHNKNMTDFNLFDEMPGKKAYSIRKINFDRDFDGY